MDKHFNTAGPSVPVLPHRIDPEARNELAERRLTPDRSAATANDGHPVIFDQRCKAPASEVVAASGTPAPFG